MDRNHNKFSYNNTLDQFREFWAFNFIATNLQLAVTNLSIRRMEWKLVTFRSYTNTYLNFKSIFLGQIGQRSGCASFTPSMANANSFRVLRNIQIPNSLGKSLPGHGNLQLREQDLPSVC